MTQNLTVHFMRCRSPHQPATGTISCSVEELNYAIQRGAVGATSNPVIVLNVLKKKCTFGKTSSTRRSRRIHLVGDRGWLESVRVARR